MIYDKEIMSQLVLTRVIEANETGVKGNVTWVPNRDDLYEQEIVVM